MTLAPSEQYLLGKAIWTDADFENMGWHDVIVHAVAFDTTQYELLLDIDYIFAWVTPESPSPCYSFWLAPATLVFREVWDLKIQYAASLGFQMQGIQRSESRIRPHPHADGKKKEWHWTLGGNEGDISLWAIGFAQYTRVVPVRHKAQAFSLSERGGFSLERPQEPRAPNNLVQPTTGRLAASGG